jgi:hypothetical protein
MIPTWDKDILIHSRTAKYVEAVNINRRSQFKTIQVSNNESSEYNNQPKSILSMFTVHRNVEDALYKKSG